MPTLKRAAWRALALVALLAVVGGCATRQAYNRSAHGDISVVCIIEPNVLSEYRVVNAGHPGNYFGLIGGLIALADAQIKTSEFSAAAIKAGLDVTPEFRRLIIAGVDKRGYKAKVIAAERRQGGGFVDRYDALDSECDAYVDAIVFAGYIAPSPTADYFPSVGANVRVVKRRTGEIVYRDAIAYGYSSGATNIVQITADPQYRFKDFAALMANVPLAVQGLKEGVPKVVAQVESDLQ